MKTHTITLADVENRAQTFAGDYAELAKALNELDLKVRQAKAAALPKIRRAAERCAESREAVIAAINLAPDLFESPLTREFHGVKCGFQTYTGKLEIKDEQKTIARIRKLYTRSVAKAMLNEKVTVDKTALKKLPPQELKKLGAKIAGAGKGAIAVPVEGEVDAVVAAIIKDVEA